ncbi:hypothetical protein EJ02DRAFT_428771 [Clathrospora elynae]|uniref:Uncharacterized protein n=1 Tax=Clathrospora elynae TaxID=706981 RepID=A0A6A5SCA4_9PLEO|nr:hypothetical protein EJ02DRAFT_428771 [Clathrospora elynae]
MASSIECDQPLTTPPTEAVILPTNKASANKDISGEEATPEVKIVSVVPAESVEPVREIKNADDTNKVALDLPFQSPKPATELSPDDTSVEEGEISDDMSDSMAGMRSDSPENEGKQGDFDRITKSGIEPEQEAAMPIVEESVLEMSVLGGRHYLVELSPMTASFPTTNGVPAATNSSETATNKTMTGHSRETAKIQKSITMMNEDDVLNYDAEVDDETPKPSQPTRSVPPHMRPEFQPEVPHQYGLLNSRHSMPVSETSNFNDTSRGPRYPPYEPRRDYVDREQLARISAQLMKTKNELDSERKKNAHLRSTVQMEERQKLEGACSSMLANLLHDQVEALTLKAQVEAKARDLDFREKKIEQYEVYLSEGQKQVKYELEKQGVRPMSTIQLEHVRREVELNVMRSIADVEGKIYIKAESLRLREASQQMREQQYRATIRESVEKELRQKDSLTSEKANEMAEIDYNDGYVAGKEAGRKEAIDKARKLGFLEGYGACHRAQVSLSNFCQGRIPFDSPELAFVHDLSHPHNLFTIGAQIGELEAKGEGSKNGETKVEMKKPVTNGRMYDSVEEKRQTMQKEVIREQKKTEEPIRKMPPPRPTFASELRGASPMHNGHFILANKAASCVFPPTPKTNGFSGGYDIRAPAPAGRESGRRVVRYEGSEYENLIDFD